MLIGIDVGYSDTKDSNGNKFKSAYAKSDNSLNESKRLTINERDYFIGTGTMTSEVDKTGSDINMVCTIYDIILNNAKDIYMVVGLPIGQYNEQKDKLKESIIAYNKYPVIYNDKPYQFQIKDVIVCRQGVSALYTLKSLMGEYIVIDIGGLTVDSCQIEFSYNDVQLIQKDTWYKGIRTLYSPIIEAINNQYKLKLDTSYAEKILINGLSIHGKLQDLSFLKPLLQDYIDTLAEEIKLKYPYETVPIYLTGGGAELLYNPFCKRFSDVHKINNPQFANALGYYYIGYFKYAQRGVEFG